MGFLCMEEDLELKPVFILGLRASGSLIRFWYGIASMWFLKTVA